MKIQMRLHPEHFARVLDGTKCMESRIFDEKRQMICLGDEILFVSRQDLGQKKLVRVTALLHYPTFESLMNDFDPCWFGRETMQENIDELRQFYSKEEEEKYSVLGIKFEIV